MGGGGQVGGEGGGEGFCHPERAGWTMGDRGQAFAIGVAVGVAASFLAWKCLGSDKLAASLALPGAEGRVEDEGAPSARRPNTMRVAGVFVAPTNRDAPVEVDGIAFLEKGVGVRAGPDGQPDRYAARKGSYSHKQEPGRQVTLISSRALDGVPGAEALSVGDCRRNILIECGPTDLNELVGRHFSLGTAKLFSHRLTVPCKPLEKRLKVPGLMERLWDRAGISCEVLESGTVQVGDALEVGQEERSRIDTLMTPDKFVRPSERGE